MTTIPYKFYKIGDSIQMLPGTNVPDGATEVGQQDFLNYYNANKAMLDKYYANNDTPGLKDAFQKVISGATNVAAQYTGPVTATNSSGLYATQEAADYAAKNPQSLNQGTSGLTVPPTPASGASGGSGGQSSPSGATSGGYYKVAVPVTPQNPGGFDVYDASGNKVTYESLPKDAQGNPLLNIDTLPVKSSPTSTPFDPTKYGISAQQWATLDTGTKAFVESITKTLQGQYDAGLTSVSINADLLNKAMAAAKNDPDIQAKYGDAFKIAQADVQKNLGLINTQYATDQAQTAMKQENDRKALAEQYAAAGTAYSGFREQAKSQLAQEQSGVIESSKRALQSKLDQMGSGLESTFGSTALPSFGSISAGGLAYSPTTGITGSAPLAEKGDIYNKGVQEYNMVKTA